MSLRLLPRLIPATLVLGLLAAGCSGSRPQPAPTTRADTATMHSQSSGAQVAARPDSAVSTGDSSLSFDPATNTVTFNLVAGPFAFNGYANGGATLTVPPGSNNVMNFSQADGTPHSAEIASASGPLPNSGGDPAIPRAYTNKVVEGLAQGATDVMRFTAPDSGAYRIICGVPGHALSGMWIWYKVEPSAKAPTFRATSQ